MSEPPFKKIKRQEVPMKGKTHIHITNTKVFFTINEVWPEDSKNNWNTHFHETNIEFWNITEKKTANINKE